MPGGPGTQVTTTLKSREVVRRFKAFRKRNLITQKELADWLGISRFSVCQIENQRSYPRYSTLRRFNLLEEQEKAGDARFRLPVGGLHPVMQK